MANIQTDLVNDMNPMEWLLEDGEEELEVEKMTGIGVLDMSKKLNGIGEVTGHDGGNELRDHTDPNDEPFIYCNKQQKDDEEFENLLLNIAEYQDQLKLENEINTKARTPGIVINEERPKDVVSDSKCWDWLFEPNENQEEHRLETNSNQSLKPALYGEGRASKSSSVNTQTSSPSTISTAKWPILPDDNLVIKWLDRAVNNENEQYKKIIENGMEDQIEESTSTNANNDSWIRKTYEEEQLEKWKKEEEEFENFLLSEMKMNHTKFLLKEEEYQTKIDKLEDENTRLKTTIHQKNEAATENSQHLIRIITEYQTLVEYYQNLHEVSTAKINDLTKMIEEFENKSKRLPDTPEIERDKMKKLQLDFEASQSLLQSEIKEEDEQILQLQSMMKKSQQCTATCTSMYRNTGYYHICR